MTTEVATTTSVFSSPPEADVDYDQYRSVCTPAILGLVFGVLSALAFLDWGLLAIPVLGTILAVRGWLSIRSRPQELTGMTAALLGLALSLGLGGGATAWLTYVYVTEVPEGYKRIDYSYLRPAVDRVDEFPSAEARGLDGQDVFIKGYIYPQANSKFQRFLLCRDNGDCCFGGTPPLTDVVMVTLEEGAKMEYTTFMVKIAGKFRVEPAMAGDAGGTDGAVKGVVYQIEGGFPR